MKNYENRALEKNFGTGMKWRNKLHFTLVRRRVGRIRNDFFAGTVRMSACVIAVEQVGRRNHSRDGRYGATLCVS